MLLYYKINPHTWNVSKCTAIDPLSVTCHLQRLTPALMATGCNVTLVDIGGDWWTLEIVMDIG